MNAAALDAISSTEAGTSPLVLEMPALLNRITSFLCTLDKKFAHRCEIQDFRNSTYELDIIVIMGENDLAACRPWSLPEDRC
jgi:hypothetical protein